MRISVIHSSRGRPAECLETVSAWISSYRATTELKLEYRLGVEIYELEQYAETLTALQTRWGDKIRLRLFQGPRFELEQIRQPGFKFPPEHEIPRYLTANTKGNTLIREGLGQADWFVTATDNLTPPPAWNIAMLPTLQALRGTVAILGYWDQLKRKMIPHPVITPEFFAWNRGSLMYPGYYHICSDVELYILGKLSGKLHWFDESLVLHHRHPYKTTDGVMDQTFWLNNNGPVTEQGKEVFAARRAELVARYGRDVSLEYGDFRD